MNTTKADVFVKNVSQSIVPIVIEKIKIVLMWSIKNRTVKIRKESKK